MSDFYDSPVYSPMSQDERDRLYDKYGALLLNFEAYFPKADDPEDKSAEFIQEYRLVGEANIRFAGIEDQIKLAIKHPTEFTRILNVVMGYELSPNQTTEYMIDLYNKLTNTDELRTRAASKDPDALMSYYFVRPVRIPFSVPYFGREVPLWVFLVVSLFVAGFGWLGFTFLKFPVIEQLFLLFLVVGAVGMLFSVIVMYSLRDEAVNADRYEERNLALREYRESRQRKKSASRWRVRG